MVLKYSVKICCELVLVFLLLLLSLLSLLLLLSIVIVFVCFCDVYLLLSIVTFSNAMHLLFTIIIMMFISCFNYCSHYYGK